MNRARSSAKKNRPHILTYVLSLVHLSVFEQEMTKVLAKTTMQNVALQFLYLTNRHRLRPKLKIRRVV